MKNLFGTDGIRSRAGTFPLDEPTVRMIGRSLARRYREQLGRAPRFVTGRDTRESGPRIEAAFCDGASAEGAVCESAGILTTPGIAFVTNAFRLDAGVVISASHNPYEDNGIKFFAPDGRKLGEEAERAIEHDIVTEPGPNGALLSRSPEAGRAEQFQTAYLDHLAEIAAGLNVDGLRIVVDSANGAASHL